MGRPEGVGRIWKGIMGNQEVVLVILEDEEQKLPWSEVEKQCFVFCIFENKVSKVSFQPKT